MKWIFEDRRHQREIQHQAEITKAHSEHNLKQLESHKAVLDFAGSSRQTDVATSRQTSQKSEKSEKSDSDEEYENALEIQNSATKEKRRKVSESKENEKEKDNDTEKSENKPSEQKESPKKDQSKSNAKGAESHDLSAKKPKNSSNQNKTESSETNVETETTEPTTKPTTKLDQSQSTNHSDCLHNSPLEGASSALPEVKTKQKPEITKQKPEVNETVCKQCGSQERIGGIAISQQLRKGQQSGDSQQNDRRRVRCRRNEERSNNDRSLKTTHGVNKSNSRRRKTGEGAFGETKTKGMSF